MWLILGCCETITHTVWGIRNFTKVLIVLLLISRISCLLIEYHEVLLNLPHVSGNPVQTVVLCCKGTRWSVLLQLIHVAAGIYWLAGRRGAIALSVLTAGLLLRIHSFLISIILHLLRVVRIGLYQIHVQGLITVEQVLGRENIIWHDHAVIKVRWLQPATIIDPVAAAVAVGRAKVHWPTRIDCVLLILLANFFFNNLVDYFLVLKSLHLAIIF